ncbi:hypothetical protein ACFL3N_01580 [Candidatus Omnitrophota bacterium]
MAQKRKDKRTGWTWERTLILLLAAAVLLLSVKYLRSVPDTLEKAERAPRAPAVFLKRRLGFGTGGSRPGALTRKIQMQKGVNYVTWRPDRYFNPNSDRSLEAAAEAGVEWVALVTTWYQHDCSTTEIFPSIEKTPTDGSIAHAIRTIHSLGMKVLLKPQIDVLDVSGGAWRGEIVCVSEPDWRKWFESYGNFILYHADMAQKFKVDLLCIGVELTSVATMKDEWWRELVIGPTREIYDGPLVYAANWDKEYRDVTFWDAMDYVGIDAYFPLSDEKRPTFEELKAGWHKWLVDIEDFQAEVDKPIIFTEVGYCSAPGAAIEPWIEIAVGKPDMELQADCYEAMLQTFWDKPWFYGVYWWKWGTDVRFGGPSNKGYSPQNKTAEKTLIDWYKKPAPRDPAIFKKEKGS